MGTSLTSTCINATYPSLIKTSDSATLPLAGQVVLSDGEGNDSSIKIGRSGTGITINGVSTLCGNITQEGSNTTTLKATTINGTGTICSAALLCGTAEVCGAVTTHANNTFCGECTFIEKRAAIGSNSNADDSTILTVKSTCEDCSAVTLIGNGISPHIRLFEEGSSTCFALGVDNKDSNKFKIVSGPTMSQNNTLVVTTAGKVGINNSPLATSEQFNVCGNSIFSGNTTICDSALKLTTNSSIEVSNGTGVVGQFIGKTSAGRLTWQSPGGGANCTGNICSGTTTSPNILPKFQDPGGGVSTSYTLTDSNVSDDGTTVCVQQQFKVGGNTSLVGSAHFLSTIKDDTAGNGVDGQVLTSTGSGVKWRNCDTSASSLQVQSTFNVTGALCGTAQFYNGTQDQVNIPVNSINATCLKSGLVPLARLPDINACQLQSHILSTPGNRFNVITHIENDGAMEIGKFIDFHLGDICTDNCDASIQLFDNDRMHFTGKNVSEFQFDGNICSTKDIIAFTTSDKNLKKDLSCVTNSNNVINNLNSYCFKYNEKSGRNNELGIGFIAQEVEEVLPRAVKTRQDGSLAVDYLQFIPILSEEIKRLNSKIEELESKIGN